MARALASRARQPLVVRSDEARGGTDKCVPHGSPNSHAGTPDSRKMPNSESAGQAAALVTRSRTRFVETSLVVRIRRQAPMLVASATGSQAPSFHWSSATESRSEEHT